MKHSQAYLRLYENQGEEPIITYINPKGKRVYGLKSRGRGDVYITKVLSGSNVHFSIQAGGTVIKLKCGFETPSYKVILMIK